MRLRFFWLLLLPLHSAVSLAAEPAMGAYAGLGVGKATFHEIDIFRSDFEAHDTGFKALAGYRILKGLAIEAAYADYGKAEDRGVLAAEIDAFSLAAVGLIPLRSVDLFGKAGFAAWHGTLSNTSWGAKADADDIDPVFGLGVQFRNGRLAVRAEVEVLLLGLESDDEAADAEDGWIDFISVGMSWSF